MRRILQVLVMTCLALAGLAGASAAATVEEMLAEGSLGGEKAAVTALLLPPLLGSAYCPPFQNRRDTFEQFTHRQHRRRQHN